MLKWTDEMTSGFEDLDRQHRTIIVCIHKLFSACENNAPKDKIFHLINCLDNYVTKHFKVEEAYAEKYDFPKKEILESEHEFFRAVYYRIRYHYTYYDINSGNYRYVYKYALHLNKTLEEWLDFHMNNLDRELIDFLKSKGVGKGKDAA